MMKNILFLFLFILIGCFPSKLQLSIEPKYYEYVDKDTMEITAYSIDGRKLILYSGTDIKYDENGNVISKYTYKDGKPDGEWIENALSSELGDISKISEDSQSVSIVGLDSMNIIYKDGIEMKITNVVIQATFDHLQSKVIKIKTTTTQTRMNKEDNWKIAEISEEIIE